MMAQFSVMFVRHGETELNRRKVIQGQGVNPGLNKRGRKQAQAVGRHLSSDVFTHVYSSDLIRAKETCEVIMAENSAYNGGKIEENVESAKEVKFDQRLWERNYGVMEGRNREDFFAAAKASGSSHSEYVPERGESIKDLEERGISFFNDLCDRCYCQTEEKASPINVLVVCHGRLLATMMTSFSEKYGCSFPPGSIGAVMQNTGRSCFNVRFERNYMPKNVAPATLNISQNYYRKVHMVCTELNNCDHLPIIE